MHHENELNRLQLIFQDKEGHRKLVNQEGILAQSLLDYLQQLIDAPGITIGLRTQICNTMLRLSKASDLYPSCLTIQGATMVGKHPVDGGGFGEVFKGNLGEDGQLVCLKVARVYSSDIKRFLKQFLREAIVWRQLKHPNLLPCLGLYYLDDTKERICLVSPWMENGNLVKYLECHSRGSVDRLQLMHDIASGLSHLHEMHIIHGDLKGVNILITSSHRACIADFGLSRVADSQLYKITSSTSTGRPGTVRWSAPEVLKMGNSATKESDIYSCGCVYYEILTGLPPFHNLLNDGQVILAIFQGERPPKPENVEGAPGIWPLITHCWDSDPGARPKANEVLTNLADLLQVATGTEVIQAENWDNQLFIEMQNNVDLDPPSEQVIQFLSAVEHECVARKLGIHLQPQTLAAQALDNELLARFQSPSEGNGHANSEHKLTTSSDVDRILTKSPDSVPSTSGSHEGLSLFGGGYSRSSSDSDMLGEPSITRPIRSQIFRHFRAS